MLDMHPFEIKGDRVSIASFKTGHIDVSIDLNEVSPGWMR